MNRRDFVRLVGAGALAGNLRAQPRAEADFVIVGAGSAGCVLARRLSAAPSARVVVLEAGGPGGDDDTLAAPGRWPALLGTRYDWGYRTEPEAGLDNRRIAF